MLAADREVLAAYRVQQTADLLEKEIGYVQTELGTIATQASLLAGFIFGALTMQGSTMSGNPLLGAGGSTYQNNPGVSQGFWNSKVQGIKGQLDPNDYSMGPLLAISEILFTLILSTSLISNLLCVFCSTFIMMWGPRRALMADEADMEEILINIRLKRRKAIQHFLLGVFSFIASAVVTAWAYWEGPAAITVTVGCILGTYKLFTVETDMRKTFKAPPIFTSRLLGTTYDPASEPLLGDIISEEQLRRDLAASRKNIPGGR